jgi:hypothetical protein
MRVLAPSSDSGDSELWRVEMLIEASKFRMELRIDLADINNLKTVSKGLGRFWRPTEGRDLSARRARVGPQMARQPSHQPTPSNSYPKRSRDRG